MRSIPARVAAFVLAALVVVQVVTLPAAVSAQDATPAAPPVALGAAECTVDPIDPARYGEAALLATPQASLPDVATGQPADADTITAVTDAIVQSIACTNAGDLSRLLAVIDPSYAPTLLDVPADQLPAALDAVVSGTPEPGAPATPLVDDNDESAISSTLLGIDDVVTFPDGQVAATVRIDSPQTGPATTTIYLRMAGTRYVITTYVFLPSDATPAA